MDNNEWCAIVHIDISPRSSLEEGEQLLRDLVADVGSAGTIELAALRQPARLNHFEVIGRYRSQAAYLEHMVTPTNLAFRSRIAPMLGSPYEDRLHRALGEQDWPLADLGDFVAVTQIELRPEQVDAALPAIEQLSAAQRAASTCTEHVVLQRHDRPNNLELISVWDDSEAFDAHLESGLAQSARDALSRFLVAPIDDRRHLLFAGSATGH